MKKSLKVLITLLITQLVFSQNYQDEFLKYLESNDTINQLKVLKEWKANKPNDAELFTSYFNYHFNKARKEIIALTPDKPNEDSFVIKDSLNQTAGYLGGQIHYDKIESKKGIDKINEGILLYPNRLDMRFGKIYFLGELKDWESFTNGIISVLEYSSKNNNQWTWTNNEQLDDGKDFLLASIQDYQVQLYNTGKDELLVNMREIANKVLEYYPDHIESLSNLSITYLITGEYDKGIEPLLRAEKLNPEDYIVLSNIAHGYKLKGDKEKAIDYYKKVLDFGDEEAKKFAKKQIIELED